jgi:HAD superfamily hydrolase (TIGR01484 family)
MLPNIFKLEKIVYSKFKNKKLISFDSDGTIQLTKSKIDSEMAHLLNQLALHYKVNIISGTGIDYLKPNVLDMLEPNENVSVSPTCGTRFVVMRDGKYTELYRETLSETEIKKIMDAFDYAMKKAGHNPSQTWGEIVENRETQITFSALGQKAPSDAKLAFDPDMNKRRKIASYLKEKISDNVYDIKIAGTTSVDVTRKGINKGYGIRKLTEYYHIGLGDVLFIGDRLDEVGNDYPVAEIGVDCLWVANVQETKTAIDHLVKIQV